MNIATQGSNVVSVPLLYGGTYTLFAHMLPKLGIEVRFGVDDSPGCLEDQLEQRPRTFRDR